MHAALGGKEKKKSHLAIQRWNRARERNTEGAFLTRCTNPVSKVNTSQFQSRIVRKLRKSVLTNQVINFFGLFLTSHLSELLNLKNEYQWLDLNLWWVRYWVSFPTVLPTSPVS